ncbi:MAG: TRM11 family SAM-dependent methyltransferase [Candidatus Heimdallarchaeaceae archaeon]
MTINSEYMFFKLGRNKELAKAEISTIFEKAGINRKINYFQWKEFLFVNIEKKEEQNILRKIRETGSVVKVGCCFAKCGSETEVREIIQEKNNQIINKFSGKKEKIKFSINLQIEQLKQKTISEIVRKEILKIAKDRRVEVKIIPKKGYSLELSPYQYHKENMPKRGVELVIFGIKSKIYLGETKWVTNPFFDIKLDEGRPERLFTHGTSIKIARSLINLTNTKNDGKIVDPFSGTGTLLIVGLLQNYDVIGFEKDPKCVRVAKTNIRWAIDKYKIKKDWKIYKNDARDMHKIINEKVDAIVTEPYLGPFLKNLPDLEEGKNILHELEKLYAKVLYSCSQILKDESRVVIIFPFYEYPDKTKLSINLERVIEGSSLEPVEKTVYFNVNFPINIGREHNIISRQIIVLKKNTRNK